MQMLHSQNEDDDRLDAFIQLANEQKLSCRDGSELTARDAYRATFHRHWINTTSYCGDTWTDIGFFRSFITSTPQGMGNLLLSSGNN
jgi:hypothetical protein